MAGQTSHSNVRFATFNASLNRSNAGELITDLSTPDNEQAKAVAEIIQRNNPDVLLLNEFDYDENGEAITNFKNNYLEVSQNGVDAVEYPFVYLAPSNTGIPSGFDFDNNGSVGGGNDAFGFGFFPGQFGMVLLSKYPILEEEVRTFQNFLWKDMPGALLPDDVNTAEPSDWYSEEELEVFRLSSKSHWDIPVNVNGEIIHVLASHPTPPVFDGEEDRNGKRNHDEIRFWSDYVTPGEGNYIYDDNGETGSLNSGAKFVIMGDQNADPNDGDSTNNAILQLLDNPQINTAVTPSSQGGIDAANRQGLNNLTQTGNPGFDTADFAEENFGGPGNLRADYVLPSNNLDIKEAGVFWPESDEAEFGLVGDFPFPSSDHRLVYADVENTNVDRKTVGNLEFLGEVNFPTGLQLEETEVGGISGLAYDAEKGIYYGLSDDRSQINPARFYDISINLEDGSLDDGDISFDKVTTLLDDDGNPFGESSLDPEGIVLTKNNTLFISSEGDANQLINPFVNEFSINGQEISELPVPDKFNPTANQSSGIRNNAAFESLTITPDQRYLYTAVEDALFQDGERADLENGSLVRIAKYDLQTREVVGEFVYELDEVAEAPNPADGFKVNGLVELLATDNKGSLLALERSFSAGVGNTVKLFEVQTQGALDVSGVNDLFREDALEDDGEILEPGVFEIDPAVSKRLLIDFEADLGITPDNLEALAFGPTLADGSQSLIVASDNNFNQFQTTQFLALGLDFDTTPAVLPTVETPYTIDNEEVLEPKSLNILLVNDDGFEA
ncbi:MAG: esterase-like activity of phytase family protein, partial [Cyanobacteria bacterium J06633_8]